MLDWVADATGSRRATRGAEIQALWSGYGSLFRAHLEGGPIDSVVVKHVQPPTSDNHPRGWHTDLGHRRKLRSYEVEAHWYDVHAAQCGDRCRVAVCHAVRASDDEWGFILEDLDAAGFGGRRSSVDAVELDHCLRWLARFHATFLGVKPSGLWGVGSYWHLDTRPEELTALNDSRLREAAAAIDRRLNGARFQSFVHGDAKLANFCFAEDDVAAVDFQYVGGGCGIKDVAYFFSSCLSSTECEQHCERLLDDYFGHLRAALVAQRPGFHHVDALEQEWRSMYALAWADFQRFLAGWSPGHWKLDAYAQRQTDLALESL